MVTTTGVVEGFQDGDVTRFRGIPYARPPVGQLRLRSPRPALPWNGVLPCRDWKSAASQRRIFVPLTAGRFQQVSEDCLTVNVTVPQVGSNDVHPVMFYIHGGAYILGSSSLSLYDGADLARNGCVFVSVNYRVGALGAMDLSSLSGEKHRIDSNLYLRDLVLALEWVRDNIAAFGGDPANVTIFGESAGAHCVQMLLSVPSAAGLFHRAICQSTAAGMIHTADEAAANAQLFARILGTEGRPPGEAVRTATPRALVRATHRLLAAKTSEAAFSLGVGPSIDGDILPAHPVTMMERGQAHHVPLIVGYNAEEVRLFNRILTRIMGLAAIDASAVDGMLNGLSAVDAKRVLDAYADHGAAQRSKGAVVAIISDAMFGSESWRVAQAHTRHSDTYFYRYDYAPQRLRHRLGPGAGHLTELFALFGLYKRRSGRLMAGRRDIAGALRVTEEVQRRWLQFARTGNPGIGWPAYDESRRQVLVFDTPSRIENDPNRIQRELWREVSAAT